MMFTLNGRFKKFQQGGYNNPSNPQIEIEVGKECCLDLNFSCFSSPRTGLYLVLVKSEKSSGRTAMKSPDLVVGKSKYMISESIGLKKTVLPGRYIAVLTTQKSGLNCQFKFTVGKAKGVKSAKLLEDFERHNISGSFKTYHGGYNAISNNPQYLLETKKKTGQLSLFITLNDRSKKNSLYLLVTKPAKNPSSRKHNFSRTEYYGESRYLTWDKVDVAVTLDCAEAPFLIVPASSKALNYTLQFCTDDRGIISKVKELRASKEDISKQYDAKDILSKLNVGKDKEYFDENPVPKIEAYCKKNGCMFKDSAFVANNDSSINKNDGRNKKILRCVKSWKRPHQFLDDPDVYIDGADVEDLMQGGVGDCWLMQGIASVSNRTERIKDLVYPSTISPYGCYAVNLFIDGKFRYIVVDDFIPLDQYGRFAFASSQDKNELWVPLVEKAFAKYFGSYRALIARSLAISLTMLTGGESTCSFHNSTNVGDLFKTMKEYKSHNWLMGACSDRLSKSDSQGLVSYHAYSVLDAVEISTGQKLVKLRNTWGRGEWEGTFSDNDSRSWTPKIKKEVNFTNQDDGVFYMLIKDYKAKFNSTTFCKLVGDVMPNQYKVVGNWKQEFGGNGNTKAKNPKHPIEILNAGTSVMVSLTKKKMNNSPQNALQLYCVSGSLLSGNFTGKQVEKASGYWMTDKVRFEHKFSQPGLFHIIPACQRKSNDSYSIMVRSDKDVKFGGGLKFADPWPKKVSLRGKWSPCFGYGSAKNPMFKVTVSKTTKVSISIARLGKKVSMGMLLAVLKPSWKKGVYCRDADFYAKSSYLITNKLELLVDLEGNDKPYHIYICTQKKFAGLKYHLQVKASSEIGVTKVL